MTGAPADRTVTAQIGRPFGALGLDLDMRILVSAIFSARTTAGRGVYDLHGRALRPRRGTLIPSAAHLAWHAREVFKGQPLAA